MSNKWRNFKLSDIADIRASNVDKKNVVGERKVSLCNYMDVYKNSYITADIEFMKATANPIEFEKFKVVLGDVMITKDSETPYDIGIPSVVIDEIEGLVCGYHLALIKPNQELINPVFLSKQLGSNQTVLYFSKLAAGSTRYGLSIGAIANTLIRAPSLPMQKRIATILQSIDQTIEKTEALIEKYRQIKTGLMHDLFTCGIASDGKLRTPREQAPELYHNTDIGKVPKGWKLKTCGDIFDIGSGITLGVHRRPKNNARPYLRVANVHKEKIKMGDIAYLEADFKESQKYALKSHDLLVVEGHANVQQIGRCAIVDNNAEGMLFQNHLFRLRAKDTSAYFGMYALNSHIARRYWERNCSTSSGLNTINQTMLKKMPVLVPTPKEQELIVLRLDAIVNLIDKEIHYFDKLRAKKAGLLDDLLTGSKPKLVDEPETKNV